ncbi:MAG: GNAT family N-acetyltransferase [Candidatus Marinimicrobia bacterium]|nr:GNAT family N-acetyltransferase [Candidatus Neomarinimicrobiota bacterium]
MKSFVFDGLEKLNKKDMSHAVSIITNAFSEDPCLKYLLNSEEYDHDKAKFIHEYTLKIGFFYGSVQTASSANEGVSIWMPPKRVTTSPLMFIRAGGLSLRKNVDLKVIDRIQVYGDYCGSLHQKYVKEPHWYLESIAVDPKEQGKGFAGKLLRPALDYFDKYGFPCYLETHNPKNVTFYEKYGFNVMEIGKLPGTNKPHWAMLRQAQVIK